VELGLHPLLPARPSEGQLCLCFHLRLLPSVVSLACLHIALHCTFYIRPAVASLCASSNYNVLSKRRTSSLDRRYVQLVSNIFTHEDSDLWEIFDGSLGERLSAFRSDFKSKQYKVLRLFGPWRCRHSFLRNVRSFVRMLTVSLLSLTVWPWTRSGLPSSAQLHLSCRLSVYVLCCT
jgi:hypothetical protein